MLHGPVCPSVQFKPSAPGYEKWHELEAKEMKEEVWLANLDHGIEMDQEKCL